MKEFSLNHIEMAAIVMLFAAVSKIVEDGRANEDVLDELEYLLPHIDAIIERADEAAA